MEIVLKKINSHPDYSVGSDGHVYSYKSKLSKTSGIPKRLTPGTRGRGYASVKFRNGTAQSYFNVHLLICEAFHGIRPIVNGEKYNCSHINDIKTDNRPQNLIWESASENQKRAFSNGNRIGRNQLFTATEIVDIKNKIEIGYNNKEISDEYKCTPNVINKIRVNTNYRRM